MPEQSYFDAVGWSRSEIADFAESRSKFYDLHVAKTKTKPETTELQFGNWLHMIVLLPDEFERRARVIPKSALSKSGAKSGNAWKDWRDEQDDDALIIKAAEAEELAAMRAAVMASDFGAMISAADCVIEEPLFWTFDAANGMTLTLKCEPDALSPSVEVVGDLKSARDVSLWGFKQAVGEYQLWLQDAHYSMGVEAVHGYRPKFVFAAVQKSDGYPCELYELPPITRTKAAAKHVEILHDLALCLESGDWSDAEPSSVKVVPFYL